DGDYREVAASSEQVYAFTRENGDDKLLIAVNFSGSEAPVDLTGSGIASFEDVEVLLSSYDDLDATAGTPEALRPYEAIVARIR
ncbi:MAG: alpha-glucosidase C-terminal domain-containing protein, partial [Clostridia bacterium]|nr:alpha-glucosidase C-terminal domain-containing protein [Clostridia bacterium]